MPDTTTTETCYGCNGSGDEEHLEDASRESGKFACLHCNGAGQVPAGYQRARSYVCALLHYNGERHTEPALWTGTVLFRAYQLADGFGAGKTPAEHQWDWSHVRDSSPAAMLAMEAYLRQALGEPLTTTSRVPIIPALTADQDAEAFAANVVAVNEAIVAARVVDPATIEIEEVAS